MEFIKSLNLYVDWEKGKIYRKKEKGFLDNLLGIFGKGSQGGEFEEVNSPEAELKVKKYKLLELYAIAKRQGKTEFVENLNGQEVRVKIEPERVVVETPDLQMEYRADKFFLRDKRSGEVQEKVPTLQEFYQMYKEIRKLLAAGSVKNYLHLKAREPEFKQQYAQLQQGGPMAFGAQPSAGGFSWGSALLGLGGGLLLGYLLGSMMGEAFANEVETAPPLSEEELAKIEEQVSAPAEEAVAEAVNEGEVPAAEEAIPEPSLEDVEADLGDVGGDYFASLDESVLDGGGDVAEGGFADAGEDLGGFDDFGGDFDV